MKRGIWLSAAALAFLAPPAFAQDMCMSPPAPVVPDGKTAEASALIQAQKDVVAFIKASDEYQNCLLAQISALEKTAKDAKMPVDAAAKKALETKGDANQKDKERVGKAYNAAAVAYKAAHK